MPLVSIEQLDDPRLDVYRQLKQSNLTRWSGRFIAEGDKVVERLLASDWPVESVLLGSQHIASHARLVPESVPTYVVGEARVAELVGFNFHRGVLACGLRKPRAGLDAVVGEAGKPGVWLACPDVQNPDNVGGILRTAAALDVRGVIFGPRCADPLSRRVLRVSMGTALAVPWIETDDFGVTLDEMRSHYAVELIASVLDPMAESLPGFQHSGRVCLLLGSEGHGLDAEAVAKCDRRVTLPMRAGVDSLNVTVACGVMLFELIRRGASK